MIVYPTIIIIYLTIPSIEVTIPSIASALRLSTQPSILWKLCGHGNSSPATRRAGTWLSTGSTGHFEL